MGEITVVGVGPGHRDYLTRAAVEAVAQAQVLVGGHRQLELFQDSPAEKHVITKELGSILNIIRQRVKAGHHVVVLASGDPGFYGILGTIKRHLPDLTVRVIPGISSVQLACARLGITWDDAFLTSCHGRHCNDILMAVQNNKKVIALTDDRLNPAVIAGQLRAAGIADRPVYVACNLSLAGETMLEITLYKLSAVQQWQQHNCVMVIDSV